MKKLIVIFTSIFIWTNIQAKVTITASRITDHNLLTSTGTLTHAQVETTLINIGISTGVVKAYLDEVAASTGTVLLELYTTQVATGTINTKLTNYMFEVQTDTTSNQTVFANYKSEVQVDTTTNHTEFSNYQAEVQIDTTSNHTEFVNYQTEVQVDTTSNHTEFTNYQAEVQIDTTTLKTIVDLCMKKIADSDLSMGTFVLKVTTVTTLEGITKIIFSTQTWFYEDVKLFNRKSFYAYQTPSIYLQINSEGGSTKIQSTGGSLHLTNVDDNAMMVYIGNTLRWIFGNNISDYTLYPLTDDSYDIGKLSTNEIRHVYVTSITASGVTIPGDIWETVVDHTVTSTCTTLSFSGFNGDADKMYRISTFFRAGSISSCSYNIRVGSDTTDSGTNYAYRRAEIAGSLSVYSDTNSTYIQIGGCSGINQTTSFDGTLNAEAIGERHLKGIYAKNVTAGGSDIVYLDILAGTWLDHFVNIETIDIIAGVANGIGEHSYVLIEKKQH